MGSKMFPFNDFLSKRNIKSSNLRPIVYIAGPYAGNTILNTNRAIKVGQIAHSMKLGSVVPHPMIFGEVYGKDEIPEEREDGCISTLSILGQIARLESSQLWIIEKEDRSLSSGTKNELDLWLAMREYLGYPFHVFTKTYKEWIEYENSLDL